MHRSKLWPPSELEGCWACRTQTQWEGRRKPSRENHPVCQTWFFFHKKNNKKLPNLNLKISIWEFTENVSYVNTASPCSHGSSGAAAEKPIWFSREIPQRMRRECIFFLLKTFHREEKKTPTTRKSKLKMWTVGSVPKEAWLMLAGDAWWDAGLAAHSALVQDWAAWPMWKATSRFNISFWFWVS